MNLKNRLNVLEKKVNPPQKYLVLNIDGIPTDEQEAQIDAARQTGRLTFCFLRDASCYILGDGLPPWASNYDY